MDLVEHACAQGILGSLSDTERTILTYLSQHEDEVVDATVSTIARATFSSTASVIRLAQKLGFAGFAELKFFVKNSRAHSSFDTVELLDAARADTVTTIDELLGGPDISAPLRLIHDARIIYLCATGYSQRLAAKEFMKSLINYGYFAVLIPSRLELDNGITAITSEDVLIVLSLSGATPGYEPILANLRARSVPVICLAAHTTGYIAQASDHVLTYKATPIALGPRHKKDFVSLLGLSILLDYLTRSLLVYSSARAESGGGAAGADPRAD